MEGVPDDRRAGELPERTKPMRRTFRRCSLLAGFALFALPAASASDSFPPDDEPEELQVALALDANAAHGREAYAACASCHGPDGAGRPDGTFPQLAGQHASVIAKQLVDIRAGRRSNPVMLPYALRLMDAQEIADVAGYLSALPTPPDFGRGPGSDLASGGALYQSQCSRCHGEHGEGDAARFIPALAGQHYQYLLRQARDIAAGRRGNAHPEMAALIEQYDDADLQALVDYASRLGGDGAAAAPESPDGD